MGQEIARAVDGERKITVEQGFDMALVPVGDGLAGYSAGRIAAKPLGMNVRGGKPIPTPVRGGYRPVVTVVGDEGAATMAKMNNAANNNVVRANRMGTQKIVIFSSNDDDMILIVLDDFHLCRSG